MERLTASRSLTTPPRRGLCRLQDWCMCLVPPWPVSVGSASGTWLLGRTADSWASSTRILTYRAAQSRSSRVKFTLLDVLALVTLHCSHQAAIHPQISHPSTSRITTEAMANLQRMDMRADGLAKDDDHEPEWRLVFSTYRKLCDSTENITYMNTLLLDNDPGNRAESEEEPREGENAVQPSRFVPLESGKRVSNAAGEEQRHHDIRIFMKASTDSDSCQQRADLVADYCFGASRESLLDENSEASRDLVALVDDGQHYYGPLTAYGLYLALKSMVGDCSFFPEWQKDGLLRGSGH